MNVGNHWSDLLSLVLVLVLMLVLVLVLALLPVPVPVLVLVLVLVLTMASGSAPVPAPVPVRVWGGDFLERRQASRETRDHCRQWTARSVRFPERRRLLRRA
ncbi:hypothetical protein Ani05nite_26560 [Amorphoplanes nipponensis]|uniref:Uncharacterized protein n=1 Tax=Actinoplanes nipponensis TaxID=135950 RepID=A0A919JHE5_9ACTN|nr:hypothetical protein [Actinoplanes nipponensis]GIE49122.1 hypothetical protein Ani05nite_26560 [Actinoplanes nipponensis]